jgi:hypothetical protein
LDDTLDSGPQRQARGTQRLCAVTGAPRPVAEMIRFVLAPDGTVVPDVKKKLPGRGIWVTATRHALTTAVARRIFARGFRRDVRVPDDLVASTERLLERSALDALAIARKAGQVAAGFHKAEAALAHARVAGLVHAAEAGNDGIRKLAAARIRAVQKLDNIAIVTTLSGAQLDLALGRPNVVHAALLSGPESNTFMTRMARLERFRAGPDGSP